MRETLCTLLLASIVLSASAFRTPQSSVDPERLLTDRLGLTAAELGQARAGQPVAKMLATGSRDELAIVGAVRLTGDKARLADWIRNIEHFRGAAELGTAHVIPSPVTDAAFAEPALAPADRQTLAAYAKAYAERGRPGIDALAGGRSVRSSASDIRALFEHATILGELSPDLVGYLERYPAPAPAGLDQCLYWSVMPVDDGSIIALHHLVVYKARPEQVLITDQTVYASRYFDAGAVVIALADAPGGGYYAIAGSRVTSEQLGRAAAVVLRRQIEKAALDSVRMYLGWMRDSLNSPTH